MIDSPDFLRPPDLDPERFGRIEDYKFSDYQQYVDFFSQILRSDPRYKGDIETLEDVICKEATKQNPTRIVDIGCGPCNWLRMVAVSQSRKPAISNNELQLYGIDTNFTDERLLPTISGLKRIGITVNGGNIESSMDGKRFLASFFQNKPVDLAVARNVAWTLRDPIGSLLIPGLQILKPNGHLLINNFGLNSIFSAEDSAKFQAETTDLGLVWDNDCVYAPRKPDSKLFDYLQSLQPIPVTDLRSQGQQYRLR
jgi:SAM-dependent methyltransferase